jgi:hypothetical protein
LLGWLLDAHSNAFDKADFREYIADRKDMQVLWVWSENEGHAKRVEETLPMLLAVLNGDGETESCFRVEHALLLFLPVMSQLVDAAYDLIPGQLWVETLEEWGMGAWEGVWA